MKSNIPSDQANDNSYASTSNIGVLLVNLGTPENCDRRSVRAFLAEFLSDRRVIELSPWLWQPILRGIILTTRPSKVVEAYKKIWNFDQDQSPLRFFTSRQAEELATRMSACNPTVIVSWAMRYGVPPVQESLERLKKQYCQRILVVPLYPQYSATSTATVTDKVFDILKTWRWQPALRTLPPYFDHPAYIQALSETVETYLAKAEHSPECIVASYHGLPKQCIEKGDPYFDHCTETTRLLRQRLDVDDQYLKMTFQSRFGPKKWLEPATDQTLIELAQQGIKRIAVLTPGFAVDCLETLEEMGIQNCELFLANGGEQYDLLPCLNDSETGTQLLDTLVRQELGGWI